MGSSAHDSRTYGPVRSIGFDRLGPASTSTTPCGSTWAATLLAAPMDHAAVALDRDNRQLRVCGGLLCGLGCDARGNEQRQPHRRVRDNERSPTRTYRIAVRATQQIGLNHV